MPLPEGIERQQALLRQLHAADDPVARAEALQLAGLYHTREQARLAADVYMAARQEGQPPPGWVRASQHPDLLRDYDSRLSEADVSIIGNALSPPNSGFRAEIYLPDPSLQAIGYRPQVVFKGSAGEVMTRNGLRDTTMEDYFANNFPQSIGMETDYYDRGMRLAVDLNGRGFPFELAGHSLGGGVASAASAVTGVPATTFNAAGLNPATPRRFVQQNPHAKLHDVSHLINAYEVQGDLLTQGVQGTLHTLGTARRAEVGSVLQEVSRLATGLPAGRELLQRKLDPVLPLWAQPEAAAFIQRVANSNVDTMLQDLPQAAGQVHELPAMMRQDGDLLPRPQDLPLSQIMARTGPVWETLDAAAQGARAGEFVGAGIASMGRGMQHLATAEADVVCATGEAVGQGLRTEHRVIAAALDGAAAVQERGAALPSGLVATPGMDVAPWVARSVAQMEVSLGNLERDAVAKPACKMGDGWKAEGRRVANVTARAPQVDAAAGALVGGGVVAGLELGSPTNAWRLQRAVRAVRQATPTSTEALDRHSMQATVLPSLEARIGVVERQARDTLQRDEIKHAALAPMLAGNSAAAQRSVHAVFAGLYAMAAAGDLGGMRRIAQVQLQSPRIQALWEQGRQHMDQQQVQAAQRQSEPSRHAVHVRGPVLH